MMRLNCLMVMCALLLVGCTTNREALDASMVNSQRISGVEIGQTMWDVIAHMNSVPEKHSTRVEGQTRVDEWSWVTNYDRHVLTTISFRDGVVTGIAQDTWDGAWDPSSFRFSALKDAPREEHADATTIMDQIEIGDSYASVISQFGAPDGADTTPPHDQFIYDNPGAPIVVVFTGGKVSRVHREGAKR